MASGDSWKTASSIYEFSAKTIDGEEVSLSKYKGDVVLVVNVASKWGATAKNYTQLQELHKLLADKGLRILGFPCNQFGGQEPGSESEIKVFVKTEFNVEFDMFSKINVNGDGAHPLFKYLKMKLKGTFGDSIKWNFSKFLINRQGVPVKRYSPTASPINDCLKDIEEELNK